MLDILTGRKQRAEAGSQRNEICHENIVAVKEQHLNERIENFRKSISCSNIDMNVYSSQLLTALSRDREIAQGAFYSIIKTEEGKALSYDSGFASNKPEQIHDIIEIGDGFPGQVAKDGKIINISEIPEGYLSIETGLGKTSSVNLILFPVKYNEEVISVIELASFHKFTEQDELFYTAISGIIAEQIINNQE